MALMQDALRIENRAPTTTTAAAPAPAPAPAPGPAPAPAPAAPAPAPTPAPQPTVPSAYNTVATGSQTKATTGTFDESKGVAGRVASIAASGSPLMDLARTQAAQQAQGLGLRRSSMAVGAAQDAVLRQAVPIATADAQGYQTQQLANQDAKNTVDIKNADRAADIRTKGLEADTRRILTQMEGQNRIALTELEAAYRTQIGANENVANAWGTMLTEIGKIQANPDMGANAKKTYINNLLNGFKGYAEFWGAQADIDVDDLLDFGIQTPSASAPAPAPSPNDQGGGA